MPARGLARSPGAAAHSPAVLPPQAGLVEPVLALARQALRVPRLVPAFAPLPAPSQR